MAGMNPIGTSAEGNLKNYSIEQVLAASTGLLPAPAGIHTLGIEPLSVDLLDARAWYG